MSTSTRPEPPREAGNLRPDAFAGTAEAYLRFRPPYPRALLDDLVARAAPPRGGVLVDLASGPGRAALDLAGAFGRVLCVDLEPEMVAVGRAEAARRGIGSVAWAVGRAEDAEIPPASVDLIVIGEAFHRLDQPVVAGKAMRWLKPGGWIATLGTEGLFAGGEPWKAALAGIARRWMAKAFPEGWAEGRPGATLGPEGHERVLAEAGFVDVASREFAEPKDWSLEAVLGSLRSSSVCSERALAGETAAFEAEVAEALGPGPFREVFRSGYTAGRKPG